MKKKKQASKVIIPPPENCMHMHPKTELQRVDHYFILAWSEYASFVSISHAVPGPTHLWCNKHTWPQNKPLSKYLSCWVIVGEWRYRTHFQQWGQTSALNQLHKTLGLFKPVTEKCEVFSSVAL